ncbi:MAG TPA: ATP-binding protein [Bacteroidia bacterium]
MSSEITILLIDSNKEDFILIRNLIEELSHNKFILENTSSYEEGLRQIIARSYDVYLIDFHIDGNKGVRLIQEAIQNGCDEPLILLTKKNDAHADAQALEAGAADYIVKDSLTSRQLESSLRYCIEHAKNLKAIKDLNSDLEIRVRERTLILEEALNEQEKTKARLRDALQKEKDLNELKSRFVSMASHEFRTPLATILSSLSLIEKYLDTGEKEKQKKHIDRIQSAINQLTEILNDVLSLSKLEEGKVSVKIEKTDLKEFTTQIIKELQNVAKNEQKINYSHVGRVQANVDKSIMKNILFNLISNAIKFSPEGKNIEVQTRLENSHIELMVSDRGIGISEEDQKNLFERFYRGFNATNIEGTGLGLNIVAKYVELLKGSIDFNSELEKGTTFNISIPN